MNPQTYIIRHLPDEDCWQAERVTGARLDRQESLADALTELVEVIADDFDGEYDGNLPVGLTLHITARVQPQARCVCDSKTGIYNHGPNGCEGPQ